MAVITKRRALTCMGFSLVAAFGFASAVPASAGDLDREVDRTLSSFYGKVGGAQDIANRAEAILVFPSVIKAGIGIGGEYGEGALLVRGRTNGYYALASASIGFQLGAQQRSIIIAFMTPKALASFRNTDGWKIGVDGSVALIAVGAGGSIETNGLSQPVLGFVFDGKGLMYNLTLEGTKISRLAR